MLLRVEVRLHPHLAGGWRLAATAAPVQPGVRFLAVHALSSLQIAVALVHFWMSTAASAPLSIWRGVALDELVGPLPLGRGQFGLGLRHDILVLLIHVWL